MSKTQSLDFFKTKNIYSSSTKGVCYNVTQKGKRGIQRQEYNIMKLAKNYIFCIFFFLLLL